VVEWGGEFSRTGSLGRHCPSLSISITEMNKSGVKGVLWKILAGILLAGGPKLGFDLLPDRFTVVTTVKLEKQDTAVGLAIDVGGCRLSITPEVSERLGQ
jgi:hypothetical protein